MGESLKIKNSLSRVFFWVLICTLPVLLSCSTGGSSSSGASPVASVPLPEDVTISSPDSDGFVTVTAVNDFVPDSATVIITVSASSTSLLPSSLPELLTSVTTPAYASTCSSDLPECPDLDDGGSCQHEADATGSFTTQVPADETDTIAISYLDPDSCAEVEVYTGLTISDNILSLNVEAQSLVVLSGADVGYVVGSDSEGHDVLLEINLSDDGEGHSFSESLDFTDLGYSAASDLDYFEDHNENAFLVGGSTAGTFLLSTQIPDLAVDVDIIEVVGSGGTMETGLTFVGSATRTYQGSEECGGPELSVNDEYTQLYFQNNGDFKIYEYGNSITDPVMSGSLSSGGGISPVAFGLSTASEYDISSVNKVIMNNDDIFFVVQAVNSDLEDHYYVMSARAPDILSCVSANPAVNIDTTNDIVDLGAVATSDLSLEVGNVAPDLDDEGNMVFILPIFIDGVRLSFVDLTNFDPDAIVEVIEFSDEAASVTVMDAGVETSNDLIETEVSSISNVYSFGLIDFEQDSGIETFILGQNGGGSDFINLQVSTDSVVEPEDSVTAISPRSVDFYEGATNNLLILDAGNSDDHTSNLIFYELAL